MALIKCDECGRMISDKSKACPHCGYPTELNSALTGENHTTKQPEVKRPVISSADTTDTANMSRVVEAPLASAPVTMPAQDIESKPDDNVKVDSGNEPDVIPDDTPAPDPRNNERNKLLLFIGVFVAILIIVGVCFYFGSKTNAVGDEGEEVTDTIEAVEVPIDTVVTEQPEAVAPEPEKKVIKKAPNPEPTTDNNGKTGESESGTLPPAPKDPSLEQPTPSTPTTTPKSDDPDSKSTSPLVKLKENH